MHVVILHSMNQQKFSSQLVCVKKHAAIVISCFVFLRRSHEALGIDRVVLPPIHRTRACDRCLEDIGISHKRNRRHISAIRHARDSHSRSVDSRASGDLPNCCGLIIQIWTTQFQICRILKGLASTRRPSVVDLQDDKAKFAIRTRR